VNCWQKLGNVHVASRLGSREDTCLKHLDRSNNTIADVALQVKSCHSYLCERRFVAYFGFCCENVLLLGEYPLSVFRKFVFTRCACLETFRYCGLSMDVPCCAEQLL
jgi:hypothetical protein